MYNGQLLSERCVRLTRGVTQFELSLFIYHPCYTCYNDPRTVPQRCVRVRPRPPVAWSSTADGAGRHSVGGGACEPAAGASYLSMPSSSANTRERGAIGPGTSSHAADDVGSGGV